MRIITIVGVIALLALVGGCGNAESGLKKRAAEYYNFMAGLAPRTQYSSFFTPAYRKTFNKETLKKLNLEMGSDGKTNERYKPVAPRHISVVIDGRFAYSNVSSELGQTYTQIGPARWVRVGRKWYLYLSSGAESAAYGSFPSGFAPPAPPLVAPEATERGKK